jgi:hypothetical protein
MERGMQTSSVQPEPAAESTTLAWVVTLVPLVVFAAVLVFMFRVLRNYDRYMRRAEQHMALLEKKSDRMIELLERLAEKRD